MAVLLARLENVLEGAWLEAHHLDADPKYSIERAQKLVEQIRSEI